MKKNLIIVLFFSLNSFSQGLNFSKDFYEKGNFIELTRSIKPTKKSLSGYASTTHFQKGFACVTHAIAQGLTILYTSSNRLKDKNEINSKSFSPYYGFINLMNDFNSGINIEDALNYTMNNGNPLIIDVEFDKFYPFNDNNILNSMSKLTSKEIRNANESSAKFKLKSYKKITTIEGVKQSISKGFPVLYGVNYITPSLIALYNCKTIDCYWRPSPEEKKSENWGGHAMLIVGYDDDKEAVQVLNSWGKGFGNNGYFWIKYENLFTGYIFFEECLLDTGSGNCLDYENKTVTKKLTTDRIEYEINRFENIYKVNLPRTNGFGYQAYSLEGFKYHKSFFYDEYTPLSIKDKCQW